MFAIAISTTKQADARTVARGEDAQMAIDVSGYWTKVEGPDYLCQLDIMTPACWAVRHKALSLDSWQDLWQGPEWMDKTSPKNLRVEDPGMVFSAQLDHLTTGRTSFDKFFTVTKLQGSTCLFPDIKNAEELNFDETD